MSDHEILILLVGGLATLSGGCASVILSWLRGDIRNLAASVASLREEFHNYRADYEQVHGILRGKGLV